MILSETIPTAYQDGFARAQRINPSLAERYVTHTTAGDPQADAVLAALSSYPAAEVRGWIHRGVEHGPAAIPEAPAILRDFLTEIEVVPDWFSESATRLGCRAFHRHSEMFLGAFVGAVLVEGFSTLISQSFNLTGRIVDQGVQRLKQNNRQLVEIFLPGGLDREGEGWKLSVRVRLIHAQVRVLLSKDPNWNTAAWGTPISAAHVGFSSSVFSALLLKHAAKLGVNLSEEERRSFMLVWRYAAHLMGVVPELLFENEAAALQIYEVGRTCEPPPTMESVLLCNALINSAPIVAGVTAPKERHRLARYIYRVSRALIGDTLADQLKYPKLRTKGILAGLRTKNKGRRLLNRLIPALGRKDRAKQFQTMLKVSHYSKGGISYRMPENTQTEKDAPI